MRPAYRGKAGAMGMQVCHSHLEIAASHSFIHGIVQEYVGQNGGFRSQFDKGVKLQAVWWKI